MYRDIGEYISVQSENAEYGDAFVQKLADFFATNYPELKGFNRRGLYRMKQFYELYKKDTEIREHEMEMARMADKKDTEKKEFDWKVLGAASFVVLTAVGIGTAALGGKFDFKLPKKS